MALAEQRDRVVVTGLTAPLGGDDLLLEQREILSRPMSVTGGSWRSVVPTR
jgi:hypothetical protein